MNNSAENALPIAATLAGALLSGNRSATPDEVAEALLTAYRGVLDALPKMDAELVRRQRQQQG